MRRSLPRRFAVASLTLACALMAVGCDGDDDVGVPGLAPPTAIDGPQIPGPELPPEPAPDDPCTSALDCPIGDLDSSCRAQACVDGACTPILAPVGVACTGDDLGECQIGRCTADGTCAAEPAEDGSLCRTGEWAGCQGYLCEAGACVGVAIGCDDGNPCTLDECEGGLGCVHDEAPGACDDGNPCTEDSCDPDLGCSNVPTDGAACDDGDLCTGDGVCAGGLCADAPFACDDGNFCTLDLCDPETGACGHTLRPEGTACDDGQACTRTDRCSGGLCVGIPYGCDDDNVCTRDLCDGDGCVHMPDDGVACSDDNPCTTGDVCHAGLCRFEAMADCSDDDPCTLDWCDATEGCQHQPLAGCVR